MAYSQNEALVFVTGSSSDDRPSLVSSPNVAIGINPKHGFTKGREPSPLCLGTTLIRVRGLD